MKKKIILIGSGGHAASCIDVIESSKKYQICGFVSDNIKPGNKFLNYPILSNLNDIEKIKKITKNLILAFGSIFVEISLPSMQHFLFLLIKES